MPSIGEKLVYPADPDRTVSGLTYREWLIGQALASPNSILVTSPVLKAAHAIQNADAIIAQLDREQQEKGDRKTMGDD